MGLNLWGILPNMTPQEWIDKQLPILIGCIIIGWLSVSLMQLIVLSQGIKIYKTKSTASISIWTFIIFGISSLIGSVWAYCYYIKQVCSDIGIALFQASDNVWELSNEVLHSLKTVAQWSIIPLIFYNTFNIIASIWITILKAKNIKLAKQKHCSELEVAKYLLAQQKQELVASNYKLHKRKYFWFVLILIGIYTVAILVCVFTTVFLSPNDISQLLKFSSGDPDFVPFFFWADGLMIISIITSFANEAFGWPTFITILRKRDTSALSMGWAIFVPITLTVSFFYGLILATAEISAGGWASFPPDTIGSIVFNGLIVNYGILILKAKNARMAKKLGMSELKYTEDVLIPEYNRKVQARQEVLKRINEQQLKVNEQKTLLNKLKTSNEKVEQLQKQRVDVEQNKLNKIKSKSKETQNKLIKESEKADKKHGKR